MRPFKLGSKKNPYKSIVASAQTVAGHPISTSKKQSWQDEAWGFYDESPELRYGIQYMANAMSRVNLYAGRYDATGTHVERVEPDHPAAIAIQQFGGGPGGQAQLLSRSAQNLAVAGIGNLVGEPMGDYIEWTLYSQDDVQVSDEGTQVRDTAPEGATHSVTDWRTLPNDAVVVIMWRPHARHVYMPDSPVRAALSALSELELLNERIAADALSRLAGAGVFVVPSEATFPKAEGGDTDDDDFTVTLQRAMTTSIHNRDDASAVVPLVVRVPGEYAVGLRHITFSTPFDEKVIELRTQAISRLAVGLELPNEVLTGMADVNHWSAWQIEESAVKLHTEPMAELICDAVTQAVVEPVTDDEVFCWYETSELRVRPDRSESAVALYDRQELSGEATRRETGFSETDAPTPQEAMTMLLRKIAFDNPELLPQLVGLLVPDGQTPDLPELTPGGGPPGPSPDDASPSGVNQPGPASGEESKVKAAALTAACDAVVMRALERAGAKLLRLRKSGDVGVPQHLIHTKLRVRPEELESLTAGACAWIPEIAERHNADVHTLSLRVLGYISDCLMDGCAPDYSDLEGLVDVAR